LTQDGPDRGASARNRLLTYLAAEDQPAPTEAVELQALFPEEPESGPEELARLRQVLAQNERAALHSTLAEFDLRQRLEEAEQKSAELQRQLEARSPAATDPALSSAEPDSVSAADAAKLKADWRRAMKALEQENKERRSELVLVRGQLHQTQRQLELEYTARMGEAAKSSTLVANLEAELEEAHKVVTNSNRARSRRQTIRGVVAGGAMAAGALAVAAAIWTVYARPTSACAAPEATSAAAPSGIPARPVAAAQPLETFSLPGVASANSGPRTSQASEPNLAGGMDRLNGALAAFPNRRPEEILREIHRKAAKTDPSLCAFDWNNGQPSIVYGAGGTLSLSATIDKCAAAIEKYR
jgi:hypothetical protein